MITRLDTGALKEVFNTITNGENEVKEEEDISLDHSFKTEASDISKTKENKSISLHGTNKIDTDKGNEWQKLMNLLIQLRKVCNQSIPVTIFMLIYSPYMFPNSEPEPYVPGEHVVLGSGKFMLLDKLLPKLFSEDHRVLLFSGFTMYPLPSRPENGTCPDFRMLDVCEDYFNLRGWKYARLDGSTTRPRRALDIKLFNQKNSRTLYLRI